MANITVTVSATQQLALDYVLSDASEWANNAVHERARKASLEIVNKLVTHCNANEIAIATGEAAQLQQAYDLNIINTAQEREDAAAAAAPS